MFDDIIGGSEKRENTIIGDINPTNHISSPNHPDPDDWDTGVETWTTGQSPDIWKTNP